MVKSRVVLSLLVLAGLLITSAPASAQVNSNGFSFGTTFVLSTVDDGARVLLQVFGFHADNSGVSLIDVKCPVHVPRNLLDDICGAQQVGDELEAMSGHPPDTASDTTGPAPVLDECRSRCAWTSLRLMRPSAPVPVISSGDRPCSASKRLTTGDSGGGAEEPDTGAFTGAVAGV